MNITKGLKRLVLVTEPHFVTKYKHCVALHEAFVALVLAPTSSCCVEGQRALCAVLLWHVLSTQREWRIELWVW